LRHRLILIGTVAALATSCLTGAALALEVGQPAPSFKLADQFGKDWDLAGLRNNVVVVVAANRDSGRAMGPWVGNLKDKYGDRVKLLGLLELKGIPGIARGMARSRIRKETKEPLMIDFSGSTGKAYMVSSKHPVVVVIDKAGIVREVQSNGFSDRALKSVSEAIDRALK
jgi:hypothetical protein